MKVAAICPNSAGMPGSEYIYDADTIEEARTRGYRHCCGSEYVGRIIAIYKKPGESSGKWHGGEELWTEGGDNHYIVDEICQMIHERFGIKATLSGRHERLLFCPNTHSNHFARISVDPDKATIKIHLSLLNIDQSWDLADPKCFDKILDFVDQERK